MTELVDKKETYVLFRIWRTLKQMVDARGYLVLEEDTNITLDQWKERFGDKPATEQKPKRLDLTFLVQHADDESDRLYVFFPDNMTVNTDDIGSFFKKMQEGSVKRGIIAVRQKITPMARTAIQEMKPAYTMEQFTELELMVNITEHMYVPKHTVLSEEGKQIILSRYKMTEDQIPRIQESDPIARYFGLVPGQLLKIVRQSPTAGRYVTYRICMT